MKRIVPILIMFSVVCYSCIKDNSKKNNNELYTQTYHVTGFSQSSDTVETGKKGVNSVKALDVPVSAGIIDVLYCIVYDASGNAVSVTKQLSTDSNFGTISNNLAAGTYTVVFGGGKTGLGLIGGTLSTNAFIYSKAAVNGLPDDGAQDTFYKKITLTVGSNGTQNIVLDRIVAKLIITIQDKLPIEAKYISLFIQPWLNAIPVNGANAFNYHAFGNDGSAPPITTPIPADKLGTSNFTFSILVFNTVSPFKLTLLAHKELDYRDGDYLDPVYWNDKIIVGKVIQNVTARANKTTIITGTMFGGPGTGDFKGFNVLIDPEWNPTSVTVPF